jgi:acyl-coenzyme A thioesterase PaaI-like protein
LHQRLAGRRQRLHDHRAESQPLEHRARRRDRLRATPAHLGRTTQVWDATVTHRDTGKTIALFRCTQMVLYKKA